MKELSLQGRRSESEVLLDVVIFGKVDARPAQNHAFAARDGDMKALKSDMVCSQE